MLHAWDHVCAPAFVFPRRRRGFGAGLALLGESPPARRRSLTASLAPLLQPRHPVLPPARAARSSSRVAACSGTVRSVLRVCVQVGAHYLKDLFDMFVAEPFKVRITAPVAAGHERTCT